MQKAVVIYMKMVRAVVDPWGADDVGGEPSGSTAWFNCSAWLRLGCAHANRLELRSLRSAPLVNPSGLSVRKLNCQRPKRNVNVRAEYGDHRGGTGGDFVAGFLLGGAVFGALGYVFAPQIRRSLLNEDEYGFRKAKHPNYYDEGLEVTWQNLNKKIGQLNSAIDNVSSRLRGRNKMPRVPVETDPEEATM